MKSWIKQSRKQQGPYIIGPKKETSTCMSETSNFWSTVQQIGNEEETKELGATVMGNLKSNQLKTPGSAKNAVNTAHEFTKFKSCLSVKTHTHFVKHKVKKTNKPSKNKEEETEDETLVPVTLGLVVIREGWRFL